MILIADSGSTKTDWLLMDYQGNPMLKLQTIGLNPYHVSNELMQSVLHEIEIDSEIEIHNIFFYGSGCSEAQKDRMILQLRLRFDKSNIEVYSDILGAARALFGKSAGIASILGTGSNTVLFDGKEIVRGVSSMGYQLGEDGSGASLGRELLRAFFYKELSESLREKMQNQYDMSPDFVKNQLYSKPFPNRFLASFVPFIKDNIQDELLQMICQNQFDNYFKYNYINNLMPTNYSVGLVGSISYYFADFLKVSAAKYGYEIGRIVQSPMEDIAKFHLNEL